MSHAHVLMIGASSFDPVEGLNDVDEGRVLERGSKLEEAPSLPFQWLERVTGAISSDAWADEGSGDTADVLLGARHRAGGNEARAVLGLDASDDTLAGPGALPGVADPQDPAADRARERLLLHLGTSLARGELASTWCGEPSPFVAGLPAAPFEEGP